MSCKKNICYTRPRAATTYINTYKIYIAFTSQVRQDDDDTAPGRRRGTAKQGRLGNARALSRKWSFFNMCTSTLKCAASSHSGGMQIQVFIFRVKCGKNQIRVKALALRLPGAEKHVPPIPQIYIYI